MANDRDLDDLLDQALAQYVDQEPDPSLRARITTRIAETTPQPRRTWLLAPLAACAATVIVVTLVHTAPSHVPHPDRASIEASSPQIQTPHPDETSTRMRPTTTRVLHPNEVRVGVLRRANLQTPHVRSLPTPSSLTPEETILLKFATEHPEQARAVLAWGERSSAPLDTPPLSITPIHIASLSEQQTTKSLD